MPTYYNLTFTPTAGGALSATSDATAIGILHTDADLAEWRNRADNGPYKNQGDAFDPLVPGEWNRIVTTKDSFAANPTADRKSSYTVWQSRPDATVVLNHVSMVDAAFYALVKEDAALATVVKDELMWHANHAGLQISRTQNQVTDHGNWFRTEWLERLLMCADFVKESFSAGELTTFKTWIADWAYSYEYSINLELTVNHFGNRTSRDYDNNLGYNATNPYFENVNRYAYMDASGVKHHQIAQMHQKYNNRKAIVVEFFALAGVFLDDALLMDRGKLFVEEWIQFGVFADGSQGEFERNSNATPQQGLAYMTTNIGTAAIIASALEKNGDPSLFTYTTRNGIWGTECATGDADKTLKLTLDTYFDMVEHLTLWYYEFGTVTDDYIIDDTVAVGTYAGKQWLGELYFAPIANRYWKDERIRKGYLRQNPGSPAYPATAGDVGPSGPYQTYWRGFKASIPSILFMFGEMEDISGTTVVVNPDVSTPITGNSTTWQNRNFGTQSGIFNVEYDVVPNDGFMDGVTGLSLSAASAYSDLAVIVRFTDTGFFDARNAGVYEAASVIPYTVGTSYHVRIVGDTVNHTFSAFVTPAGGSEVLLANNYAFRTQQNTVPSLDNLAVFTQTGSHTVSNFTTGDYVAGQLVQTVAVGTDAAPVTATADAEYGFVNWTGDHTGTENPLTITNVQADMAIAANFVASAAEFTVTFAANGGSITGDASQLIVSGEDCTAVTVVPNANYSFTQWSDANTDNPRTVTNVTSNQALTATCVIDTYSVDFTAGTGGSITGTASQTIDHGSDATQVTATAATDYAFTAWSGDATGTTNPLTITNVTADTAIVANFTSTVLDHSASTLSVSALSVLADGTSTSTITVQVKEDGVNATSGGHTVALVEDGNATIVNSTVESVTVSGTANTEALANTKAITFTSGLITRTRTDNNVKGKIGGC